MTDQWQKAREAACYELRQQGLGLFAAERAVDAALSAFSAAGWELVPREPTDAMLDRGVAMALNVTVTGEGGWSKYIRALYLTMLAALKERQT